MSNSMNRESIFLLFSTFLNFRFSISMPMCKLILCSGKILHIDFGDCFEASMNREKFPEKVSILLG